MEEKTKERPIAETIHETGIITVSALNNLVALAPLLLTPDNFLAGNLNLARQYRLQLLQLEEPDPQALRLEFEEEMKGWLNQPSDRKRQERFEKALEKRARAVAKKTRRNSQDYQVRYKHLFREALGKI